MHAPKPPTAAKGDDLLTLDDLEAVAALLPELARVEDRPDEAKGGEPNADGSIQMPYVAYAPEVERLMHELHARHVTMTFDWTTWQTEAQRLLEPDRVATATLDEVRRLFTTHVRKERFSEGHFGAMVRSGHIAALLRRLGALAAERRTAPRTQVRVVRGDITSIAVDAIVNAANSALCGGGGVDGAIHDAAGPALLAACRALGRCPSGEARLTPAFALPARHVIHAVGPVWRGGTAGEAGELASAYRASLELALAHRCRTISFPAISCGAYRYPIDTACALAVTTIRAYCEAHPGLDEVLLVAFEPVVATALGRALAQPRDAAAR